MNNVVDVTNRDSGVVGYLIPDTGVNRTFAQGETKKIPVEELKQLLYAPGGEYILKELLIVHDKDVLNEILNIETEPEYFYTEAEVRKLLQSGSYDQLADALDFAPDGVIELIKKIAVEEEVPDTRKRDLITEKTGFNINSAIQVNHLMNTEEPNGKDELNKKRRTAPLETEENKPSRRVETPNYKVVSQG